MEPDVYVDSIDYDHIENDFPRHLDTLCPSWTGDGQEIPVVVVTPQDTLNTETREGNCQTSFKDAKNVYLDRDEKDGDIIKEENKEFSSNDEDDEGSLDAELQKFGQGMKRKRKAPSGNDDR